MNQYFKYLRILWARRWVVLGTFLLVAGLGATASFMLVPRHFEADLTLVLDARQDQINPNPWQAGPDINTQIEVLRSDRVARKAVALLEIDKDEKYIALWRTKTQERVPIETFLAGLLQRGLSVEPARTANLINLSFRSDEAAFAAKAANAIAQAYLDVAIELRVAPARQYAVWFEEQSKALRGDLERAQARLSQYQQERRIIGGENRLDEELARLSILTSQLAAAQAERAGRIGMGEFSPDVQGSAVVQGLKAELARSETRLTEVSNVLGANHPQRIALEAQVGELRRQLANEVRRASGSTAALSQAANRKVAELEALIEQQKQRVLAMRGARDEISVLMKDVENAQRAYDTALQRMSQLNLESQNQQATMRVLSPAIEPLAPKSKALAGAVLAVGAGVALAVGLALLLEALDPRARSADDLAVDDGVPVIGLLRPEGARQPAYRRFALGASHDKPLLPAPSQRP
jgi:chain length determinant protein EpsF